MDVMEVAGMGAALLAGFLLGVLAMYVRKHSDRAGDEADERRRRYFAENGNEHARVPPSVTRRVGLHRNSRGMVLASQQLFPCRGPVRAVVGMCHGFGDHSNGSMVDVAVKLVGEGYAVLLMDVEGHGLSDGLHCCLHDVKRAAADLGEYFADQMSSHGALRGKPFFLYGISMGGAVAFNISTMRECKAVQDILTGVVLCAPMVKVSDELKPPDIVVRTLSLLARWIPLAPITPIPNVVDRCFKDPRALQRALEDTLTYRGQPRLRTALAMLEATDDISARMGDLRLPVLILHGGDDTVTCPKLSAALYESCSSEDKTLRIYPGCWHEMISGEYEEQAHAVYTDMMTWMKERWA